MLLPWWLLEGGIVWVAGAVAAFAARQEKFSKVLKRSAVRAGMAALCCLALVITKLAPDAIGDVAFGLSVAAALPVLAMLPTPPRPIEVISLASSEISYTLYLTHFPLLSLIVLTGFAPHRLQPSVTAAAVYGILLFLAIVWAATVWWCFERNTGRVYNFLFEYLALGEARGKPIEASKRA